MIARFAVCAFILWEIAILPLSVAGDAGSGKSQTVPLLQDPREAAIKLGQLSDDGKLEEAVSLCTAILQQSDLTGNQRQFFLEKRAAIYAIRKDYEHALSDIDTALTLFPDSWSGLFLRAETLQDMGRYREAMAVHARLLQLRPNDWQVYFRSGLTQEHFGWYAEALKDFTESIRLNPTNGVIHYCRGETSLSAGRYKAAEKDFTDAIKVGVGSAKSYYLLGQAQFWLGRRKQAQSSFEQYANLMTTNVGKRLARIGSCYADLPDHAVALEFYDQAVNADPTNPSIFAGRGSVRDDMGDFNGAWDDLQKSLRLSEPGWYQYCLRAWLQLVNGQYEQSTQDYRSASRFHPEAPVGYLMSGANCLLMGKHGKAREVLEAGLRLASDKAEIALFYVLAGGKLDEKQRDDLLQFSTQKWPYPLVQFYLSKLDEKEVFRSAKDNSVSVTSQKEGEANFFIGAFYTISGRPEAKQYLEKAKQSMPYNRVLSFLAAKQLERDFLTGTPENAK